METISLRIVEGWRSSAGEYWKGGDHQFEDSGRVEMICLKMMARLRP